MCHYENFSLCSPILYICVPIIYTKLNICRIKQQHFQYLLFLCSAYKSLMKNKLFLFIIYPLFIYYDDLKKYNKQQITNNMLSREI